MGQVQHAFNYPTSELVKPPLGLKSITGRYPAAMGKMSTGAMAGGKGAQSKHKGQIRVSAKSTQVDADELRWRLGLVLAEQNIQKQRSRGKTPADPAEAVARPRVQTLAKQPSKEPVRPTDKTKKANRKSIQASSDNTKDDGADATVSATLEAHHGLSRIPTAASVLTTTSVGTHKVRSADQDQDRLRDGRAKHDKSPNPECVGSKSETPVVESSPGTPYHHVPRCAAAQFANTATAEGMAGSKEIHSLARKAFKEQQERATMDRTELVLPSSAAQQNRALKRAKSQRESAYGRNQFQDPGFKASSDPSTESRRLTIHGTIVVGKSSKAGGMLDILEAEELNLRNTGKAGIPSSLGDVPAEKPTIDYVAVVNEHRIDWTQSDEGDKKRTLPMFRKKAEAILGGKHKLHLSNKNRDGSNNDTNVNNNLLTVKGDDSLSPVSPSPLKSPRLAFLGKFKRQ